MYCVTDPYLGVVLLLLLLHDTALSNSTKNNMNDWLIHKHSIRWSPPRPPVPELRIYLRKSCPSTSDAYKCFVLGDWWCKQYKRERIASPTLPPSYYPDIDKAFLFTSHPRKTQVNAFERKILRIKIFHLNPCLGGMVERPAGLDFLLSCGDSRDSTVTDGEPLV